jgi:hypothetical protein
MGYIRNETMVVSGWDAARVLRAHGAASAIFDSHKIGRLVSGLVQHLTNGGAAFFISPDGSKEGWHDSDLGDAARKEFIAWLRTDEARKLYLDWALIVLGGDDGEFTVTQSPQASEVPHE